MSTLIKLIASTGYLGHSPKAPGTVGSIGAFLAIYGMSLAYPVLGGVKCSVILAVALTVISVVVSNLVIKEEIYESKDPKQVVIDEWAGYAVAVIGHNGNLYHLLAGLVLFRIFDIWKPAPVAMAEKLPNGWGITMDDVVAGAISAALLYGLIHLT